MPCVSPGTRRGLSCSIRARPRGVTPRRPSRRGHDVAVTVPARSHWHPSSHGGYQAAGTARSWVMSRRVRRSGEQGRPFSLGRFGGWLSFNTLAKSLYPAPLSLSRLRALRWTKAMLNPRAAFAMAARAPSGPPRRCSSPAAASRGTRWPRWCSSTSRRWTSSRRHCASTSTIRPSNPSTPRRSCRSG
jgi:hypothetical protein